MNIQISQPLIRSLVRRFGFILYVVKELGVHCQKWPSRGDLQILKINDNLIKIKVISLKSTYETPEFQ